MPDAMSDLAPAHSAFPVLIRTALEAAPGLPVSRRIFLYRELAEIFGTAEDSQSFLRLADSLESAEAAHTQLALQFATK
jgi:hypothetical protein